MIQGITTFSRCVTKSRLFPFNAKQCYDGKTLDVGEMDVSLWGGEDYGWWEVTSLEIDSGTKNVATKTAPSPK